MRLHTHFIAVFIAISFLPLPAMVFAGSGGPPGADQEAEEALPGYKINERILGNVFDIMTDINTSFPETGALLPWTAPEEYFDFKKGLCDKYGIRFAIAYQTAYQAVSDSLTDKDSAWGGWLQLEGAWMVLNRGKDNQGTIVAALDGRHTINKSVNATPARFYCEFGSLWATDGGFLDWDVYSDILFWEQRLAKDTFRFRVGQQATEMVLDFFRFGDDRTQFSGTQLSFPASTIPYPAAGLGISARWFPIESSDLYLRGIVQDINSPAGKFDWSALFEEGEVFTGAELGYSWIRAKDDFDHAHVMMWYADEASTKSFPTEAGWGAKVHGSKE